MKHTLHNDTITLYRGDCLDIMRELPDQSVDAIITDPPFGTTACKWDSVIPFEPMWAQLKRIIKPRGAIVLFGSQPFTSALVMSNPKWFRYQWVWNKDKAGAFTVAKSQPLRVTEDIAVFGDESVLYNPQMTIAKPENKRPRSTPSIKKTDFLGGIKSGEFRVSDGHDENLRHPVNLINIKSTEKECNNINRVHPSQKPEALLEYLVKTYTNPGDTFLDFTFGSCTAGVAAVKTKRRFIGIERDETYFDIGLKRVQQTIDNLPPMDL